MDDEAERYERDANRWLILEVFFLGVTAGLVIAWLIYLVSA